MDHDKRIYLAPGPVYWSDPIWAIVNKLEPDVRTGQVPQDGRSIAREQVYANQAARQDLFDKHRQSLRDLHKAGKLTLLTSAEEPAESLTIGVYVPRPQAVQYLIAAGFEVRQDIAKQKVRPEEAFPPSRDRSDEEWAPEEIEAFAIRHDALQQDPSTKHRATHLLAAEHGISEERIRQLLRRPEALAAKAELAKSRERKIQASVFNPKFVDGS